METGLQALSEMAWAQLPLLQTKIKMIGWKSVIFDRKRIFCHGPFAIATQWFTQALGLMKPRFRQLFFWSQVGLHSQQN